MKFVPASKHRPPPPILSKFWRWQEGPLLEASQWMCYCVIPVLLQSCVYFDSAERSLYSLSSQMTQETCLSRSRKCLSQALRSKCASLLSIWTRLAEEDSAQGPFFPSHQQHEDGAREVIHLYDMSFVW